MPYTLKNFLDIPLMRQGLVRTAQETLDLRPIEYISVIEIPVENFVRKNELVLTTAMVCDTDVNVFKGFVQDVYEAKAAALVISTGVHIKSIPQEILDFAESVRFPLIEIPWELRFADITAQVLAELNNWHQANLALYQSLQKNLLNLFLKGASLSDAADLLRQGLGSPVVIINNTGAVKGCSTQAEAFLEKLTPCLKKYFAPFPAEGERSAHALHIPDNSLLMFNIQTPDKLHGYLFVEIVSGKDPEALSKERENVKTHIITTLTLWFQREQAILEVEMRLKDDFVWSIAKGEFDSWDTMDARAKSMGYSLEVPYVCLAGIIDRADRSIGKLLHIPSTQWLQYALNIIEQKILLAGKHLGRAVMMTFQQEQLIVFLEVPDSQAEKNVTAFLDLLEHKLEKLLPDMIISWGIGENQAGVKTFHKSYMEAKIALNICYSQKGSGNRFTYANTGIYRMLLTLTKSDETKDIVRMTIGKLVEYDKYRGLDLINTFKAYVSNHGNVSQTARFLNLHRQSLLYRLKKIETLTNRSLENTDDLFLLNLCIRLWTIGGIGD